MCAKKNIRTEKEIKNRKKNHPDLDEGDRAVVLLEGGGRDLVLGRQPLAVAAPGRVELDEGDLVAADLALEVRVLELDDVAGRECLD